MTIPLTTDVDGDCTASLRNALRNAPTESLAIDLSGVPYLTSAALTELVRFRKTCAAGESIVLKRPNALVLRTLHIVGFNKLFSIENAAA
jgi:anti-anti-sigma factor